MSANRGRGELLLNGILRGTIYFVLPLAWSIYCWNLKMLWIGKINLSIVDRVVVSLFLSFPKYNSYLTATTWQLLCFIALNRLLSA